MKERAVDCDDTTEVCYKNFSRAVYLSSTGEGKRGERRKKEGS